MAELKNPRFEINNRDEEKKSIKSSWRTEVGVRKRDASVRRK